MALRALLRCCRLPAVCAQHLRAGHTRRGHSSAPLATPHACTPSALDQLGTGGSPLPAAELEALRLHGCCSCWVGAPSEGLRRRCGPLGAQVGLPRGAPAAGRCLPGLAVTKGLALGRFPWPGGWSRQATPWNVVCTAQQAVYMLPTAEIHCPGRWIAQQGAAGWPCAAVIKSIEPAGQVRQCIQHIPASTLPLMHAASHAQASALPGCP